MNFKIDLHTHTLNSGHAFSTLSENIEQASKVGLKVLGISDHGPAMPGGTHRFYFQNFGIIPRQIKDLRLLCGVEANIVDAHGNLDLPDGELSLMDFVIASLHGAVIQPQSKIQNKNH